MHVNLNAHECFKFNDFLKSFDVKQIHSAQGSDPGSLNLLFLSLIATVIFHQHR